MAIIIYNYRPLFHVFLGCGASSCLLFTRLRPTPKWRKQAFAFAYSCTSLYVWKFRLRKLK